jgi:hypothetical protein
MKLSTIKWLSATIVMPLFIGILEVFPADAEQIDRSRTSAVDPVPSVTELNLMVPLTENTLPSDRLEPSNEIEPVWSNPKRSNPSLPIIRERTNKAKAKINKQGEILAVTASYLPSSTNTRSNSIDSITGSRNSGFNPINTSTGMTSGSSKRSKSNSRKDIAAISRPPLSGNYLRLVRDPSRGTNDVGNPIYILEAYVRGEKYQTFTAVSGTARSQNADRNRGENTAPLPDGSYRVSNQIVPGNMYEVGKTFIGIFPKFETGRTSLGIHLDRSFNQRNGFDGTAGCIGIATVAERDAINEFVTKYRPHNLFVKIATRLE